MLNNHEVNECPVDFTQVRTYASVEREGIISQAQSLLTKNGEVGPRLPYEQALQVLRDAGRPV